MKIQLTIFDEPKNTEVWESDTVFVGVNLLVNYDRKYDHNHRVKTYLIKKYRASSIFEFSQR